MSDDTTPRKVLVSPVLMREWATRDAHCNRISVEWGEPDAEGFYEPVFTTHMTDNPTTALRAALDKATRALGGFLWLGNNLHNSDTETFRDMYRAALGDARDAYEARAALLEAER